MIGIRFNRLLVESFSSSSSLSSKRAYWNCKCDCGNSTVVMGKNLRRGLTQSCGCLRAEMIAAVNASHGMTRTPTYMSYRSMLSRCYNPNQDCHKKYGALGVVVCVRWLESFENFLEDMGRRPKGTTLDRRNPFGNYEPRNCRWSTAKEQGMNKRGHVAIAMLVKLVSDGVISCETLAEKYEEMFFPASLVDAEAEPPQS